MLTFPWKQAKSFLRDILHLSMQQYLIKQEETDKIFTGRVEAREVHGTGPQITVRWPAMHH